MPAPTGLQRREIFIDARDLQSDSDPDAPLTPEEYAALLTARGTEKLAENRLVRSFSTEVRTVNPTYIYGEDFQIGDTITCIDERLGVIVDAVVTGAQRSAGQGGDTLALAFGYSMPTLHDILTRKAGK